MRTATHRQSLARLAQVQNVAEVQQMTLWNIAALVRMMDGVEEIHRADFPDEIAAGIRMIRDMTATVEKLSVEVL